jgi:Protein of unknown function (DUF2637)
MVTLRRFASLAGALIVAAIAALASYSHMRGLAIRYGQPELIADLLPVSVDGMMIVATVALGDGRQHRLSAWAAFWTGVAASVIANVLAAEPSGIARCISAWPAVAFLLVVEVITRGGRGHAAAADPQAAGAQDAAPATREPATAPEPSPQEVPQRPTKPAPRTRAGKPKRRPTAETRELAANLRAKFPAITRAELARQLGISATRLRQVERAEGSTELSHPINGSTVPPLKEVSS